MITDFDIYNFIETYGVLPLRTTNAITLMSNNGDGTYRVNTTSTLNLKVGDSVTISGVPLFAGRFEISLVTSTYFYISRKFNETTYQFEAIGNKNLPLSYTGALWVNELPLFEHDRIDRLNAKINQYSFDVQKYPLIAMIEQPVKREYTREFSGTYDLTINNALFIFAVPVSNDWNRDSYESECFTPMRQLAMNFIDVLELTNTNYNGIYVEIIQNFIIDDYFQFMISNNKVNLDSGLGGVSLTIPNLTIKNAGQICQS